MLRKALAVTLCLLAVATNARTWPTTVGEGSVSRWSGDRIAAFTLTIDDNHPQDHAYWQGVAGQYGHGWTWFVITGNVGNWAAWQVLVDQGHGIGSHGVTDYSGTTPGMVEAEYRDSQEALTNNLTGVDALTLAYPNGYQPPNDSTLAALYYIAARGVVGGVNQVGSINYTNTHSISMNPTTVYEVINPSSWMYYGHLLNTGHPYYGGWYSVHFHSVQESMKAGITNMLDALDADEADIWVGTFQQVAQYGQEFKNSSLTTTNLSSSEIRFTLTDTLDDTLFYFPLTVKLRLAEEWGDVAATQGGQPVSAELVQHDGNRYALVQAVPDRGEVVLSRADPEGLLVVVRGLSHDRIWVDGSFAGASSGSYAAPYTNVQAGLNAAAPGSVVTVREGTYREQITLLSGTTGQPITLSAAPGERVVLNAMTPVTDWQPMTEGLYSRTVAWEPAALYSGFRKMILAREPNEGWWQADSVSDHGATLTLTSATNLIGFPYDLANASVYLWTQTDDRFYTCPILSIDPASGSVEIEKVNPAMVPAAGDKYWLQNQVSLIDRANEWAVEPEGENFRIYYRPEDPVDLTGTQISPESGRVVSGQNVAHVRLEGLEVAGGADHGIYLLDAQDVEINRCIVHDNVMFGIWMDRAEDCSIRNTVSMNNRFGVVGRAVTNILVEGSEIGPNSEDGLVFSGGSSNLTVRRNHIHDHLLWGHPDNSQTYLGVTDLHYIENLIVSGRQSVMMQDTADVEFSGNMVIGSVANMLNFGHGTVTQVAVHGNTLACSGYGSLNLTGETTYEVRDNVFMAGHGSAMYKVTDSMDYQGDHNLFWNGTGLVDPVILVSAGAWDSGSGTGEQFSVAWDLDGTPTSQSSAPVDTVHANLSATALTVGPGFSTGIGWPDAVGTFAESWRVGPTIWDSVALGSYFSFTLTPDAGRTASYDRVEARMAVNTGSGTADITLHLMASQIGFTGNDALDTAHIVDMAPNYVPTIHSATFDLGGTGLTNLSVSTEFRIYVSSASGNRIGIGHTWSGVTEPDDLIVTGTLSTDAGGSGGGSPETIYHTTLSQFQTTTGLELNSTHSDPLFVNAPFGINVIDAERLHQATRDTFALRDANRLTVGDHVEINFDGVVRTVTASSSAVVTVDPPLAEKPLKDYLIANWGTNTHFSLDLGLQPGSPGIGLGQGGDTVGSTVPIQQFQRGDFDGDGTRDLPDIPEDIER